MRRIAAVVVTTGALVAGMGAVSTSADASVKATKSWVTKGKKAPFGKIRANGTYKRTGSSVTLRGRIQDYKRDGWVSGVQFATWGAGKWHYSNIYSVKIVGGGPADQKFNYNYGYFWSSSYSKHLSVREVALKRSNTKSRKYAAWKKLY